jgi:hypothetical protein
MHRISVLGLLILLWPACGSQFDNTLAIDLHLRGIELKNVTNVQAILHVHSMALQFIDMIIDP